jgi:hypothetical protein
VITEAGSDPKVAALVYIAAFAPDSGESVDALIKNPPPGAPVPPILPPQDGFLTVYNTLMIWLQADGNAGWCDVVGEGY